MNYEIVLYFEDDVWVAEVPELPGCACHADTEEAALHEVKQLISEWIEAARQSGRPIPRPAGRMSFA